MNTILTILGTLAIFALGSLFAHWAEQAQKEGAVK